MEQIVSQHLLLERSENVIVNEVHPSSLCPTWVPRKSARFLARFSCWPDSFNDLRSHQEQPSAGPILGSFSVAQVVYAGQELYKTKNRRDVIEYQLARFHHCDLIQSIFHRNGSPQAQIGLVRRLEATDPDPTKSKVVNEFGYRRFRYAWDEEDVVLDCVPITAFVRTIMIVPDPYASTRRYGLRQRLNDLPDTSEHRRHARFFEIVSYKYTSFDEQKC